MEDQEEQLVRMGEAAEVLLDTEAFSTTVSQLGDTSFKDFTKGRPASKSEVTIAKAEEFLASLLPEEIVEDTPHNETETDAVHK